MRGLAVNWRPRRTVSPDVQELLYARGWLADDDRPIAVEVLGYEKTPPPWIPVQGEARPGLIVPVSVALRMGLAVGDTVRVVSPRPGLTPVGRQPRTRVLPVDLIYMSDRAEDIGRSGAGAARAGFRPVRTGRQATGPDAWASEADPEQVGDFLRRGIDPGVATVTTWRQANRALLFVLRLEKGLVFSAVALIVAVASFALLAALVDGAFE